MLKYFIFYYTSEKFTAEKLDTKQILIVTFNKFFNLNIIMLNLNLLIIFNLMTFKIKMS